MLHRHHIPMLHGHHTYATRTPCPVLKHWNHTNPIINKRINDAVALHVSLLLQLFGMVGLIRT